MPALNNPRQEKFCQLVAAGAPYSEAYRQAGYAADPTTSNSRALSKRPYIKGRIRELMGKQIAMNAAATERAVERLAISKETIARALGPAIFANMADYLRIDPEGMPHIDLSQCTREQLSAIKSIVVDEFMDNRSRVYNEVTEEWEARPVRRVRLQLHDKVPSAIAVSRLFQWIIEAPKAPPPRAIEEQLRAMTPEQRAQDAEQLHKRAIQRLLEEDARRKAEGKAEAERLRQASGGAPEIEGEASEVEDDEPGGIGR